MAILIIIILSGAGAYSNAHTDHIEFRDMASCKKAQATMLEIETDPNIRFYSNCVQK